MNASDNWHREALASLGAVWQAMEGEQDRYELAVQRELTTLVGLLAQHVPDRPTDHPIQEQRDLERVKTMLRFIRGHFGEKISVGDIARSAAVSESECQRCFRKIVGTSANKYLNQFRLQMAASLLLTTDRKIVDIALECGFSDAAYFIRQFRGALGRTPSEYRDRGTCP